MITGNPKPASFSKRIRESLCAMIFLAILLPASPVMAQWQQVSSGITGNLVAGSFANDSTGYLVSADGKVLKTTDTGATWTLCGSLTGTFTSIFCTGPDTVYAGGNQLYCSPDQGATWELVATFTQTITDLCFFGSKHGFLVWPDYQYCYINGVNNQQDNFELHKTDDYGVSWQYKLDQLASSSRFSFVNDSVAYLSGSYEFNYPKCYMGSGNTSKKTLDRGITWSTLWGSALMPKFTFLSFIDQDTGYIIGSNRLLKTFNGCSSLSYTYPPFYPPATTAKDYLFINQIDAYMIGNWDIYVTASEGLAWESDHSSARILNRLIRSGGQTIFCIGDSGTILKKQVIPSPWPDSIYRYLTFPSLVNFGTVDVGASMVDSFYVQNTGNMPISLTLSTSDTFGISLSKTNFTDTLLVSLDKAGYKFIYVNFLPQNEGSYNGVITVKGDQVNTRHVYPSGKCSKYLAGRIAGDTLICKDTVYVRSSVVVDSGATLTFCKGMNIIFMHDSLLIKVKGVLRALGDSASPISFSTLWRYGWYRNSIHLQHANPEDTSVFQYCNIPMDPSVQKSIYIDNSKALIDHCKVSSANAFYTTGHPKIQLLGPYACLELRNSKVYNCGILLIDNKVTIDNCLFTNNFNDYAAIHVTGLSPRLEIRNSEFSDNINGAIRAYGFEHFLISNCTFHGNYSGIVIKRTGSSGGKDNYLLMENCLLHDSKYGIYIEGNAVVKGNRFFHNSSGVWLGKAYDTLLFSGNEIFNNFEDNNAVTLTISNHYVNAHIIQNLIYNNTSWDNGAGIRIMADTSGADTVFLFNNTICNNHTTKGLGSDLYSTGRCVFRNNIIWNLKDTMNSAYVVDLKNTVLDHNCFSQENLIYSGTGNITGNPLFKTPTDFVGYSATAPMTADWMLKSPSPCINTGNPGPFPYIPATDFAGHPRIVDGRIDMGAYEYNSSLSVAGISQEQPCLVFPNPATGYLTVSAPGLRSGELVITDCSGRTLIRSAFHGSARVSITDLPPGIYICTVSEPDGVVCRRKFVRQ